jgi:hypothetical protein
VKTRTERIEKLAEKRRQLAEEIDRMRAAEAQEERKRDARRKILVGSLVLAQVERGEVPRERLVAELDQHLTRNHDRALFDLAPREESAPAISKRAGGSR